MSTSLSAEILFSAPLLVCGTGALCVLLGEAFFDAWPRRLITACFLTLALMAVAAVLCFEPPGATLFSGAVFADGFAYSAQLLVLCAALAAVSFAVPSSEVGAGGEYHVLILIAAFGAILFASAAELIVLFVGLETMSLALYALCGARLRVRQSGEGALKYFLLGSFGSVLLLYGAALAYGAAGDTEFMAMARAFRDGREALVVPALCLLAIGLMFKLALVPFHLWAPDAYEGAPTPVASFMACGVKAVSAAAGARVFWVVFRDYYTHWSIVVWAAALLTMLLANLAALRQGNVKRMLAYSSIAHAGYLAMAILTPGAQAGAALLFYLLVYVVMTSGAFGVLHLVERAGDGENGTEFAAFNGLASRSPFLAGSMALFMLSLAGLPPGFGGLLAKFYVFNTAVKSGYVGLALVGILSAVIACAYYLRVIIAMYFREPPSGAPAVKAPFAGRIVLAVCAAAVVLLGLFPSAVYDRAAELMRPSVIGR